MVWFIQIKNFQFNLAQLSHNQGSEFSKISQLQQQLSEFKKEKEKFQREIGDFQRKKHEVSEENLRLKSEISILFCINCF